MKNQHGNLPSQSRVLDTFEHKDLNAPFRVILEDSVRAHTDENGKIVSYRIPNFPALLQAVVVGRCVHEQRLFPADVKFLRKVVHVSQKAAAKAIGMSTEHLCRFEGGVEPISQYAERILRVFLITQALQMDDAALRDALMRLFEAKQLVSAASISEPVTLTFRYRDSIAEDRATPSEMENGKYTEHRKATAA